MSGSRSGFSSRRHGRRLAIAYGLVCVGLWPIPVFGILHAEASAVLAATGCLLGAVGSIAPRRAGVTVGVLARLHLGALLVPLALLTLSLAWRPNCGYLQGLGLFVLLVPPSVLFGLGVGAGVARSGVRAPRTVATLLVLGVALGGVLTDLGLHPQLFTYSHVFGGVLGPIYDEELAIRPGLFAAKAQTLLWALALVLLSARKGERRGGWRPLTVALGVALVLSYAAAQPLGIVQTERGLQRVLSARVDLGPVVLHLSPDSSPAERRRLADEALYRFETLSARLDIVPDEPVSVYLYPSPEVKGALIGSRTTSVVPVWLPTPQVHMLADEAERSLGHELVHVLAREVGMPGLNASPAVGLVEGLAVALEPPDGLPDPTAVVVAARVLPADLGGLSDPAEVVTRTMSPAGFWTARAGVAYVANGAFAAWLLDTHGPAPLREVYRTGRFEAAYGQSLAALADDWAAHLARLPVDDEAIAVARWLFSRPSLFEVRCPHHVPRAIRQIRAGDAAWDDGDVARAADHYEQAAEADPLRLGALSGRLRTSLAMGEGVPPGALVQAQALTDSLPTAGTIVHLAEVSRLLGRDAGPLFRTAADSLMPVDAFGRLLLHRRSALDADELALWLAAPPDTVPVQMEDRAPLLSALKWSAADRPEAAWEVARSWCSEDLLAGLDSVGRSEGDRVLRLVQGTLAYRAGALTTSARLLTGLGAAFAEDGPRSLDALVRDRYDRVAWRQSRLHPPAIFADQPPVLDALAPCSAVRRSPARDGLRAP